MEWLPLEEKAVKTRALFKNGKKTFNSEMPKEDADVKHSK
jgi:hypothetical protein